MIRNESINRAIDFIIQHLDDDISIDDVARHCNYSKYYFSRLFKAETGESLYSFIKRLKVNQSAIRLQLENGKSITDIGLDYGYDSTNYSLVFQKLQHTSPSRFRKMKDTYVQSPFYQDGSIQFGAYDDYNARVQIQEWAGFEAIYERHIGNYIELKDKWQEFIEKYSSYSQPQSRLLEKSYDDPAITTVEQCIFDMCMTVSDKVDVSNVTTINGGKYAVLLYTGSVEGIYSEIQGMIHGWLPYSGYEMADRFTMNVYRLMDRENMYVEMDICIPVKKGKNS